jgi:uncharacterized Rmd1/YagE family protein
LTARSTWAKASSTSRTTTWPGWHHPILSAEFTSIAHIMVLDKPEITWDDPEADNLYLTMARLFELDQRYQEIKHKSETLLDMTSVFNNLSNAKRSARLEWIIIILIAIEIVLFLVEMATKH